MIYVMSDLHGAYERYLKMLEMIHFSEQDILYILGDIVDRGPDPIKILQDMMNRENVFPLMGNHEAMALPVLEHLTVEITEQNYASHLDEDHFYAYINWQFNGGDSTIEQFRALPYTQKIAILDYLHEFSWYETLDIDNDSFILVHAGLGNFHPHKKLSEYSAEELVWSRPQESQAYFSDPHIHVISGHTPTLAMNGKAQIFFSHPHIYIDCGAVFPQGRLGCLCLNNMQEFYI